MREIINLSIGQGGNHIGKYFWNSLCDEHNLDYYGKPIQMRDFQEHDINVYFSEINEGRYQARSLQIDGDLGLVDEIKTSEMQQIFSQSSFIYGSCGAGNCFGKGRYELELEDQVLDEVRKLVESSDSYQGFQLMRSLGGGTGSGFGDLIQSKIREEYPDRLITNFCIFPSPLVSDTVVEPYNAVLSMTGLFENSDLCFTFDNDSLFKIVNRIVGIQQPIYKDLNQILQKCVSGATAQWRFPFSIYNTMRKLAINLVPFPRLNFINIGLAPIYHKQYVPKRNIGVREIVRLLNHNRNYLTQTQNTDSVVEFGSLSIFRGNMCEQEVIEQNYQEFEHAKRNKNFWIPEAQKVFLCKQTFKNEHSDSAIKLTSGSSVKSMFQLQLERFSTMFKRKAFLYYNYGNMDEMEFTEAQSYLTDVISEYTQYEECGYLQTENDEDEIEQKPEQEIFEQVVKDFISVEFDQ